MALITKIAQATAHELASEARYGSRVVAGEFDEFAFLRRLQPDHDAINELLGLGSGAFAGH